MKYVLQLMWQELRKSLQTRGVAGAVVYLARNMAEFPTRLRRAFLEATYDRKMGVQTSRLVAPTDLGIDPSKLGDVSIGAISGGSYVPSPAWALPVILKQLDIQYVDYNFIDLGSGMGRVVLMAAEFPFARVVGVEFSQKLHEIAKDNLARSSSRRPAGSVELLLQDAREYMPPPGNCIIYMCNPFRENVMRIVLDNLKRSFENQLAQLYVVYFVPVLAELLDASSFLVKLKADRNYAIYKAERAKTVAGSDTERRSAGVPT
jgi:SAM-dependent methyltransferase